MIWFSLHKSVYFHTEMTVFLGIIGIIASFFIIKQREYLGDFFGDPEWAYRIGGIYNVMIIVAVLIFFWGLAAVTGTMDVLFSPIYSFFSFGKSNQGVDPNFIN